mmetsp:Transcript_35341/g.94706  ORF Transcript_35341/g.94706 Transcript_35341/m.94706 type:complete len:307 (-) Transcript_35341:47-967(-)
MLRLLRHVEVAHHTVLGRSASSPRHRLGQRAVHDAGVGVADVVVEAEEDGHVLSARGGELTGTINRVNERRHLHEGLVVDAVRKELHLGKGGLNDGVEFLRDGEVINSEGFLHNVDHRLILLANNLRELSVEEVLNEHVLDDTISDSEVGGIRLEFAGASVALVGDLLVERLEHWGDRIARLLRELAEVGERRRVGGRGERGGHGRGGQSLKQALDDRVLAGDLVAQHRVLVGELLDDGRVGADHRQPAEGARGQRREGRCRRRQRGQKHEDSHPLNKQARWSGERGGVGGRLKRESKLGSTVSQE